MTDLETLEQRLHEMVDDHGEVAMAGNTRSLIEEGERLGLLKAISGKFKMIEPGHLNSVYRLV